MTDLSREASKNSTPFVDKEAGLHQGVTQIPTQEPLFAPEERQILRPEDNFSKTGYAFSKPKKWWILTVVALCQTSMNYNAAVYSNAVAHLNQHYHITNARHGMIAFLVTYAFGCELWAPWSEEIGRWPVMQLSLFLVNLCQVLAGASTSWAQVLAARVLGGLFSAGGSVTLGMVADMFSADEQSHAVLWVSLWSCLGSVVGGICGGPIEQYLPWRFNFWIQLMFGGIVQVIHFFAVPETRATVILDKEAKKRRKQSPGIKVYGPNEVRPRNERFAFREIAATMWRPYHMLLTEPIVLFLSLLSGFSDALIFSFLESYGYVFKQWHFTPSQFGLAMFPLLVGYVISYLSFFPVVNRQNKKRAAGSGHVVSSEDRLWWLLWLVPLLPIGILGGAFVSTGPPLPWIAPLLFSVLIGMANYAIYYATIDYMVAAYGDKYSASATGGNGFARDFLAGMCALYTGPMYKALKPKNSALLLFAVSFVVCVPVYVIYWKGPQIRKRSKMAQEVAEETRRTQFRQERASHQQQGPRISMA